MRYIKLKREKIRKKNTAGSNRCKHSFQAFTNRSFVDHLQAVDVETDWTYSWVEMNEASAWD